MAYYSQEQKKQVAPKIKALLKKYNMKGSLAVNNHSGVVLNLKEGPIDFGGGYIQVNVFYIDERYIGASREFLKEAYAILNEGNYNNSDIHTDYFDVGWYVEINVGRWDRPYVLTGVPEEAYWSH